MYYKFLALQPLTSKKFYDNIQIMLHPSLTFNGLQLLLSKKFHDDV